MHVRGLILPGAAAIVMSGAALLAGSPDEPRANAQFDTGPDAVSGEAEATSTGSRTVDKADVFPEVVVLLGSVTVVVGAGLFASRRLGS